MGGIIRLFLNILSRKAVSRTLKSNYKDLIMFVLSLFLTIIFAYTLIYNLSDFPSLTLTQIFGIIILVPLILIFLSGTIIFAVGLINSLKLNRTLNTYSRSKICIYKDYEFDNFYIDKKNKTVHIFTYDPTIGNDYNRFNFVQFNRSEFEMIVSVDEVEFI